MGQKGIKLRLLDTQNTKALGPKDRRQRWAEAGPAEGVLCRLGTQPQRKCVSGAPPRWCSRSGSFYDANDRHLCVPVCALLWRRCSPWLGPKDFRPLRRREPFSGAGRRLRRGWIYPACPSPPGRWRRRRTGIRPSPRRISNRPDINARPRLARASSQATSLHLLRSQTTVRFSRQGANVRTTW